MYTSNDPSRYTPLTPRYWIVAHSRCQHSRNLSQIVQSCLRLGAIDREDITWVDEDFATFTDCAGWPALVDAHTNKVSYGSEVFDFFNERRDSVLSQRTEPPTEPQTLAEPQTQRTTKPTKDELVQMMLASRK